MWPVEISGYSIVSWILSLGIIAMAVYAFFEFLQSYQPYSRTDHVLVRLVLLSLAFASAIGAFGSILSQLDLHHDEVRLAALAFRTLAFTLLVRYVVSRYRRNHGHTD